MTTIFPTESIEPISDELGISTHVQETAHRIADDMQQSNPAVWGRAPSTVAAACIYVAGHLKDERLSQADVADAAGCSEATIRSIYPTVVEHSRGMGTIEGRVTDGTLRINTGGEGK